MIIGPIIIRWTKDVKAEQDKRDYAKAVSARLVGMLLADNTHYKAALRRWGLSEGLIGDKADMGWVEGSKPPKGAVATV